MNTDLSALPFQAAAEGLVSHFDSAWNQRDARALASLFTEDADFQFYYGLLVRGREKIEKYYRDKVFPYLESNLRHVTRSYKIRELKPDVILGNGRVDLVLVDEKGEELKVQRRVRVTTVAVREGDVWKFTAARVMVPVK